MRDNIFLPRFENLNKDNINEWLQNLAKGVFILIFGLLPIFFVPNLYSSLNLGFTKTYLIILGLSIILTFLALSIIRRGVIQFVLPKALGFFWIFASLTLVSALLSKDKLDSIYGNNFEVQTAGFILLMAVIITVAMILGKSKKTLARLLILSIVSILTVFLFQISRLIFGLDFLSFGIFTENTSSLIGSLNDLALFAGLSILISLILLQDNFFNLLGKIIIFVSLVMALIIVSVVNFSFVWYVLGLFSLLMLLYLLSKDTWLNVDREKKTVSIFSLGTVFLVVVTSAVFIIGGNNLGAKIGNITGINYLEVRPSIETTFNIVSSVYEENILLGNGPNRFEDAWRIHKDQTINQTYFWNTDFAAGSGFITTIFATTGLAGSVFIILFLVFFIYSGYRILFIESIDSGWYLAGLVTFVSSVYLWLMAIFYVPGQTIMLFTALFTGLFLAVYVCNCKVKSLTLNVNENKHHGFILIAFVLIVIVLVVTLVFKISKQYLAQVAYAESKISSSLSDFDIKLQTAEQLFSQDVFTAERARLRLAELNRLIAIAEPTPSDQQTFQTNLIEGISLSEKAVALDPTNPFNHALLVSFYALLNTSQTPEVKNRKDAELATVRLLDPHNPSYLVLFAQLSLKQGDLVSARSYLNEALLLKNNYTDALFLLSQIDINEDKVESAIKITSAIIDIEPNNPTRYFQLGILLAKNGSLEQAVNAFKEALRLNDSYANAHYFLALTYLDLNRREEALSELRKVEIADPDNQDLKKLIYEVEFGEFTKPQDSFAVPIDENNVIDKKEEVTTSKEKPDTNLIMPLNQNDSGANVSPEIEDNTSTVSQDVLIGE